MRDRGTHLLRAERNQGPAGSKARATNHRPGSGNPGAR